jgi:hypothetical protein
MTTNPSRKADLQKTREILWDARNLIEAIQMAAERLEDNQREVMQTLARIAMEKIDDVAGGSILDPPATEKDMARARAYIEKSCGYLWQRGGQEQAKPEAEAA